MFNPMLKTTLLTAAALSLMAFGASTADAGNQGHSKFWLDSSFLDDLDDEDDDDCDHELVKIKSWDGGEFHFKWDWRDVEDCD